MTQVINVIRVNENTREREREREREKGGNRETNCLVHLRKGERKVIAR